MIYIFDIDGTLADLSHRLHFIQQEPKDWRGFFANCDKDKTIPEIVEVLVALQERGHRIFLITGRSDEIAEKTNDWLIASGIPFDCVYMRKQGDYREDHVVKAELLADLMEDWRELFAKERVGGVFEDRPARTPPFSPLVTCPRDRLSSNNGE